MAVTTGLLNEYLPQMHHTTTILVLVMALMHLQINTIKPQGQMDLNGSSSHCQPIKDTYLSVVNLSISEDKREIRYDCWDTCLVESDRISMTSAPAKGIIHSRKQLAQWAVDVTAQFYACWLSGWFRCNFSAADVQSNTSNPCTVLTCRNAFQYSVLGEWLTLLVFLIAVSCK